MLFALFLACAEPRDPFTSVLDAEKPTLSSNPLTRVPLDAIKIAGVVDDASPRALVTLPDGSSYVVRVGDLVGDRFGVVKSIGRGRVVVVEHYTNNFDAPWTSTHVLTMH